MTGKLIRLVRENKTSPDQREDQEAPRVTLSLQEATVLRLLAEGVTAAEIASQLAINEPAVKEYIKSMLSQIRSSRDLCQDRGASKA